MYSQDLAKAIGQFYLCFKKYWRHIHKRNQAQDELVSVQAELKKLDQDFLCIHKEVELSFSSTFTLFFYPPSGLNFGSNTVAYFLFAPKISLTL